MPSTKRICRICKIEKPLAEFRKNKNCKLGREGTCIQCYNDRYRKIPKSPEGMQYCRKCNTHKKLEEFDKCKDCSSGYRYRCKDCRNKLYVKKGKETHNDSWFKEGHSFISGGEKGWFKKGIQNNPNGCFKKGQSSHNYIDGKSNERYLHLNTRKYIKIKMRILERDKYRCQECLKKSDILHVHHKVPLRVDMSLAYDENNLVTVCPKCHVKLERKFRIREAEK